jgi:hypothetical protein
MAGNAYRWCQTQPEVRFTALQQAVAEASQSVELDEVAIPKYMNTIIRDLGYEWSSIRETGEYGLKELPPMPLLDSWLFMASFIETQHIPHEMAKAIAKHSWVRKTQERLRYKFLGDPIFTDFYSRHWRHVDMTALTNEQLSEACKGLVSSKEKGLSKAELARSIAVDKLYHAYTGREDSPDYRVDYPLLYFTPDALRRGGSVRDAYNLVQGMEPPAQRYASLNAAERAHTQWIEDERRERLEKDKMLGMPYKYNSQLREICSDSGWYLPKDAMSMIDRGREHHNCVGNYTQRQLWNLEYNVRRAIVIFNKDTTAELEFHVDAQGYIKYDGRVVQCKTAYNKEGIPKGLPTIIDKLCGQPASLLIVTR